MATSLADYNRSAMAGLAAAHGLGGIVCIVRKQLVSETVAKPDG